MALSTSNWSRVCGGGRVIYPVTPNGVEHITVMRETKTFDGDLSGNA